MMILHFVDEASRYHTAKIIKEGKCNNYHELGNCHADELIEAIQEWARYMGNPHRFHVDEEGVFHSEKFKECCGVNAIEVKMAAGEAHWQNGVVERHIGTFRNLFDKLLLDDTFDGATNQSVVDATREAKISTDRTTEHLLCSGLWDALDTRLLGLQRLHPHLCPARSLRTT